MHPWLGACSADEEFDDAVVAMCNGPTIELCCGLGRLGLRMTGVHLIGEQVVADMAVL